MAATAGKRVGTNLTEGVIWKVLLTFALPIILTNVIQQLYSMVDLMIIGKFVGSTGTVGVSVGGELSDFLLPVSTAFSGAGQIYISQLAGAKDTRRIKETVGTLIGFMFLLSFGLMALAILFHKRLLFWLTHSVSFPVLQDLMILCLPFILRSAI